MFISKKLSKFQKINHGFFNRNGGKSTGIYKSLNCGLGSKDKIDIIKKNLKIVKNKISKNSKNIFLVHQFHSNKFIYINKKVNFSQKKIKADAIITDQVNLPNAVLTADCVPILLYDHKRNMIAAIHAGWKGAFKEIIKKVINFMIIKGCTKNSIIAVVGPCIQKNSYNIGEEFKKRFLKKDKKNNIFFKKKNNVLYFDLPNFVKSQLKLNKITNIDMIKIDTFDQKNNFFSARRSLRLNHDDYGRNISIIMIN